jgi:hypothetical protein
MMIPGIEVTRLGGAGGFGIRRIQRDGGEHGPVSVGLHPAAMPIAAAKGADRFHRIMRAAALVSFVTLAVACIVSLVIYRKVLDKVAGGQDVYASIKQATTLTYYLIWFGVSALALAATFLRRFPWLAFYLLLVIFAEAGGFIYYFIVHGNLFRPEPRILYERFDKHPILVARPHPGDFGFGINHDSGFRRVTVNEGKVPDPRYIYVFGGSTAYDVGTRDRETWASRLSALLGPDFAVENYGVPGYSSLQALLQSLFVFRDRPPSCAIYYEGWNDLFYAHYRDLPANFIALNAEHLEESLFPSRPQGVLETYSIFYRMAKSALMPRSGGQFTGEVSDQPDPQLSQIYRDNMRLIALIGQQFHVKVVFVPQLLNYARLTTDQRSYPPFIRDRDMKKLMGLLNDDLADVARQSGAAFLTSPLATEWSDGDFADVGHFNAAGDEKFAKTIVDDVRRICR